MKFIFLCVPLNDFMIMNLRNFTYDIKEWTSLISGGFLQFQAGQLENIKRLL